MQTSLVFTFVGADKPGLIEQLSQTVVAHGGNWLESRMSQLAGQFAGIVRVNLNEDKRDALTAALEALGQNGLTVVVQQGGTLDSTERNVKHLTILGQDRTGIVNEVTAALARHNINVCEMTTNVEAAAMSSEELFKAQAEVQVPAGINIEQLLDQLESIANQLNVDIDLDD